MTTGDSGETVQAAPQWLPASLLVAASTVSLQRNEQLFRQGDPVESVYLVLKGELKAVRYQPDGRESVMLRAAEGDFFAESAITVEHYVCDALATRPSLALAFPVALFRDTLHSESRFAFAFAVHQASAARRQCTRYERLRLGRARERVLHLLSCEADSSNRYTLRCTQAELAAELGLEPETLYRTLAGLEREGLVLRERGALQLIMCNEPSN